MMARLSVRLLGPLQVTLDEEAVTRFESDKARALLAYLAVETERPHRREKLAALLWPEWSEGAARSNLRRTLANLRRAIGDRTSSADEAQPAGRGATPPFLNISQKTIQFNSDSDAWVDVTAFTELLQGEAPLRGTIQQLEQAVDLYRGDFLEGFSVGDSPAFEEWALLERERLHRRVIEALYRLADAYEQRGEVERGLQRAWRQVELDPWRERAQRQLMRLLALSGQRGAALAQYDTCRRLLAEELGVEPAGETTRLYQQIRDGGLKPSVPLLVPAAELPSFLLDEEAPRVETPVFVARERELAQLDAFLDLALGGQGRVVFVIGEAGSGKTALAQAFTRRAQEAHVDLIVASGNCNAHTGVGDPYLPFRQILRLLTGGVDARYAAGAISSDHARRLWNTLPLAAQELVGHGSDLIDTFVPGAALVKRAALASDDRVLAPDRPDWLTRLVQLVERKAASPGSPAPQQIALFEQVTAVLRALARRMPLLLVIDDLQWADAGSINLLFHLGRQLAGSRILIVGAYRPEEVALGRAGERHPLEPVVNELRRDFGDVVLNLDRAAGRDFVEALLDSEPNRLGAAFRQTLYRRTGGRPLFTIEFLRGLQERGDLLQDGQGRWVEGPALDWETLPARVEAVIGERIARLDPPLRAALRVASVAGETFTAEVVARVREIDDQEMLTYLSRQLDSRHRLVQAESIHRGDGHTVSRYRFRHILFQKYLYGSLDDVERVHLHERVGTALEGLYGHRAGDIAVQLAHHFQEAGVVQKAVRYLHQAGTRAARLSANQEAIAHLTRGLALLKSLPDTSERARQELALQLALGSPLQAVRGPGAPEALHAADRAWELCQEIGEEPQLAPALFMLANFYHARAEHDRSFALSEQMLHAAQRVQDPVQVKLAHLGLGANLLTLGQLPSARAHLEQGIHLMDADRRGPSYLVGHDPGVFCLSLSAWVLWLLGFPDRGLKRAQEAVALANELEHALTRGKAMFVAGCMVDQLRGARRAVRARAEALVRFSTEHMLPAYRAAGTILLGWAQGYEAQTPGARPERVEEGIARMHEGLAELRALGMRMHLTHLLGLLVEACLCAGRTEEGLSAVTEALALVKDTSERYYEPELHRLRGELLVADCDEAEAEASFHKAIEVARDHSAKLWELRATVSLCSLWRDRGKREEARQPLAEIYGWFTEGFDTRDLIEARELLEQLSETRIAPGGYRPPPSWRG